MTRLFNVQLAFFIPLWRRIALVAVCLGWSLLELSMGNSGWAVLFAGIGIYCAHQFFLAFDPEIAGKDNKTDVPNDTDEGGSS